MNLNTLLRTALLCGALTASSLIANTVYIEETSFDGGSGNGVGGGEYKAVADAYGEFYTFCLESQVALPLPGTYNYTTGIVVLNQGDTLSVGTAWLYERFFKGTLSGPALASNYADNRDVNAGLLQQAIWALENEAGGQGNYYTTLVAGVFGSIGNARANVAESSKVKVMNLWEIGTRKDIQSVLVYVPDSGMTAALLGLGLLSLAAFRRKL